MLRTSHASQLVLRLRTKFLLSLILVIAGLTFATLLIVGRSAEVQVQGEIEKDTRNSILTFQNLRAERQIELNRQAELLATLPSVKALMSQGTSGTTQEGAVATSQDADPDAADDEPAEQIWRSGGYDLFALADWKGKIVVLHTAVPGFSNDAAEKMLSRPGGSSETGGWWFGNGHLYQVASRPVQLGSPSENMHLGTVIVGHEIDSAVAHDVGKIAFCQVAFLYGGEMVASSLPLLEERNVASALRNFSPKGEIKIGHERFLIRSIDLTPGSNPDLSLTIFRSYDAAAAFITRLNQDLIALGMLAVLAGAGLVFLISHTFTQPLSTLVQGVRALETGDFTYPLDPGTGDEVAEVTAAFDRMRNTLQRNEEQSKRLGDQLRQAQKMEAIGRLAGGVAHDFNNLLTVIKGHGDLLEERLIASSPLQNSVTQMKKAADRATSLTRQLLAFSRMQVLQPKVLDLNALIADISKMLPVLIGEDIEFTFQTDETLHKVKADPSQIEQVLMNLAVNARDAMTRGGKLAIRTTNVLLDDEYARTHPPTVAGPYVLLEVSDTGHGMDAQTKAQIFEPFFTTKELGKGTGLGLATVYGIVKQSGGYIWVDSEIGQGTRFQIFLPQTGEQVQGTSPATDSAPDSRRLGTVLLAEDEEGVRDLASEFLRASGFTVLVAKDGLEALEIAERRRGLVHVLVTDVVMPRMRGTELAQKLKRFHPELKIVYMSGYIEHNSQNEGYQPGSAFLQKPFSRESLLHKVNQALEHQAEAPAAVQAPAT
jgi:signal transduction histidine kinase/CheY-like chemotaxis protein